MVYYTVSSSLIYAVLNSAVLLTSIFINPRMWLHRYPKSVRQRVPSKTPAEQKQFAIYGVLFAVTLLIYPIVSAHLLQNIYNEISFLQLFMHIFVLFVTFNLVDTFVIDLFIYTRIVPNFIIIEGSTRADYTDFSYHFKSGLKGLLYSIPCALLLASISYLV